jgi:hypothetical protein
LCERPDRLGERPDRSAERQNLVESPTLV